MRYDTCWYPLKLVPLKGATATKVRERLMYIDKAEITAKLRARGLDARAAWADRELLSVVDTDKNGSLLHTLGIDTAAMTPVEVAGQPQG